MFLFAALFSLSQDPIPGPCSCKTVFVKGNPQFADALRGYIATKKFDKEGVRKSGTWMTVAASEDQADAILNVTASKRDCGVLAAQRCTVPFITFSKGDHVFWADEPQGFLFIPGPEKLIKAAMASLDVLCR